MYFFITAAFLGCKMLLVSAGIISRIFIQEKTGPCFNKCKVNYEFCPEMQNIGPLLRLSHFKNPILNRVCLNCVTLKLLHLAKAVQLLKPDAWTRIWTIKALITTLSLAFISPNIFHFPPPCQGLWIIIFAVTQRLQLKGREFFWASTAMILRGCLRHQQAAAISSQESADFQEHATTFRSYIRASSSAVSVENMLITGKANKHRCTEMIGWLRLYYRKLAFVDLSV